MRFNIVIKHIIMILKMLVYETKYIGPLLCTYETRSWMKKGQSQTIDVSALYYRMI